MTALCLEQDLTVERLLREARRLKNAQPGADFVRPVQFARAPHALDQMRRTVLAGRWRPKPLLRHTVAKRGGGTRTLCILAAADRIVQGALRRLASPLSQRHLGQPVHGWRSGRSCATALAHLCRQVPASPQLCVVQADLVALFDRLPHAAVRAAASPLGGAAWTALIDAWLTAWPTGARRGVPQGAPLSPMLANLALAGSFDPLLDAAQAHGQIAGWVRYGDDLLVAAACPEGERAARQALDRAADAADLAIHPGKTRVLRGPAAHRVLGLQLAVRAGSDGLQHLQMHRPDPRCLPRRRPPARRYGRPPSGLD